MLNEFLSSVKGSLVQQLTENAEVDSGKLDGVADVVTDTFKDGIVGKFKSGQIDEILGLLGNGGNSTPFAGNLAEDVIGNLVSKIGLSKGISSTIAKVAVPFVISKLSGFASQKGKNNEDGLKDMLGDLVMGSVKDNLLGGLGKKFGF